MLDSQIIVNLLLELGVGVDLVKHDNSPVKDLSVLRDRSPKGSAESSIVFAPRARANSQVRAFQRAARVCLRCARRWAN
jgi:hypothetical protein